MTSLARSAVPFGSAAEAWWWAWDALLSQRLGLARRGAAHPPRPCTPVDIITLGLDHTTPLPSLVVLARYGRLGYAPAADSAEAPIWSGAMAALGNSLRARAWLTDSMED
jgi:hypothetical protein